MEEKQQTQEMVEIPHDYLIEGVRQAVAGVRKTMKDARVKYGPRYNEKNDYEMFSRRFGYNDAEKIWREFVLVVNKQSTQSAIIRGVIAAIGNSARYNAIARMRQNQDVQPK